MISKKSLKTIVFLPFKVEYFKSFLISFFSFFLKNHPNAPCKLKKAVNTQFDENSNYI